MRRCTPPLLGLLALSLLGSCYRMQTMRRQVAKLDGYPRVEGEVRVPTWEGEPIVVVLLRPPAESAAPTPIVDRVQLYEPGRFRFITRPGDYRVAAFLDGDGDLALDAGEAWVGPVPVEGGSPALLELDPARNARRPDPELILARDYRLGDRISLDDPRVGRASGPYGIYQPLRWTERYVMGVFFLERYDPERTPVLFVHGISGFPAQFERWAELLDGTRYQPWFVHYPSGLPLELVSEWLARSLSELHTTHGFERLCVVAHSMGGLVAREVLNRHVESSAPPYHRGLVTIAAPFGGLGSAELGVSWSPSVAPAWRDLVPGSPFLEALHRRPLPPEVDYELLFLFDGASGADGVVPIPSQLRAEAQAEAERIRGLGGTNGGILEERAAWDVVSRALERCEASELSVPEAATEPALPGASAPR